MAIVRTTPEEDRRLEEVVPEFLRGQKNATKRVRWAIERLLELMGDRPLDAGEATPAPAKQGSELHR